MRLLCILAALLPATVLAQEQAPDITTTTFSVLCGASPSATFLPDSYSFYYNAPNHQYSPEQIAKIRDDELRKGVAFWGWEEHAPAIEFVEWRLTHPAGTPEEFAAVALIPTIHENEFKNRRMQKALREALAKHLRVVPPRLKIVSYWTTERRNGSGIGRYDFDRKVMELDSWKVWGASYRPVIQNPLKNKEVAYGSGHYTLLTVGNGIWSNGLSGKIFAYFPDETLAEWASEARVAHLLFEETLVMCVRMDIRWSVGNLYYIPYYKLQKATLTMARNAIDAKTVDLLFQRRETWMDDKDLYELHVKSGVDVTGQDAALYAPNESFYDAVELTGQGPIPAPTFPRLKTIAAATNAEPRSKPPLQEPTDDEADALFSWSQQRFVEPATIGEAPKSGRLSGRWACRAYNNTKKARPFAQLFDLDAEGGVKLTKGEIGPYKEAFALRIEGDHLVVETSNDGKRQERQHKVVAWRTSGTEVNTIWVRLGDDASSPFFQYERIQGKGWALK